MAEVKAPVKGKVTAATGNFFVAEALRQAAPDVVTAYPITPQTTIMEEFAKYVANGRVHTEYVTVESEHSSMAAAVGAAAAGARVATATSSQGLAYMWEMLHIASGMRLPIVMPNANRAISAPINIHCDHSDVMGARDTGWIILFAETAQEAYDNTVMAFRIAEDPTVMLPVMPTLDGFITTHAIDRAEVLPDEVVKEFLGDYSHPHPLLGVDPTMHGAFANLGGTYMELKQAERGAIDASASVIDRVGAEFSELTGRPFSQIETFGMEDAEYAIVILGSSAGNARHVAREMRAEGKKVGIVKIRVFRPFPYKLLAEALSGVKAVAVLDRSESFGGQCGPLGFEVRAALYDAPDRPAQINYIYGLGGADVKPELMKQAFTDLEALVAGGEHPGLTYLGAR